MRIIAGGTGFIGKHLANHWLKQHYEIGIIGRSRENIKAQFGEKVHAITWDELNLTHLKNAELIVNLAGANIGEKRWTKQRKDEILESRIKSTEKICALLAKLGKLSPPIFNASALSVYGTTAGGDTLPEAITEKAIINWYDEPDFLTTVARRWERATHIAMEQKVPVVCMRFGVVLARNEGVLPQLMQPIRFGIGKIGNGRQPFSWITIDAVVRAIDYLLQHKNFSGPVNFVAPQCVTQAYLAQTIARALDKRLWISLPAFLIKLMMGQMGEELLLKGQNVYPERLLSLGFRFHYPDINSAVNHILGASS